MICGSSGERCSVHIAVADTAVTVTAVTEIGGDALEVITTELWRDRLRDLHDLPELVVGQGDGGHSGNSFSASSSRTWRQTIDSHKPSRPLSKVYSARDLAFSKWFQANC